MMTRWSLPLLLLFVFAWHTMAAPPDRIASELERARGSYESMMNRVRSDVIASLRKKIDDAEKRDDKVSAVKQANDELAAFMARGIWPDIANQATLRSRAGAAAEGMSQAYARAMADYAKAGNTAIAAAVTHEAERFKQQSDVAPWGENRIEDDAGPRQLAPGGTALAVKPDTDGEYRLEIVGDLHDAAGRIEVEVPLVDEDKRLTIVSAPRTGKVGAEENRSGTRELKVLLSVYEGLISADVGVERPIDLGNAQVGTSRDIIVRAVGGPATIKSIRLKPVVEGTPESVVKKTRTPTTPAPVQAPRPNPFVVNAEWRGDWDGGECTVKVVERNGNFAAIRVERGNGAWWRIEGRVDGNQVIVTDIKRTRNPGRAGSILVKNGRGTVSVRNGKLSIFCNARFDGGGARNQRINIEIRNAVPK